MKRPAPGKPLKFDSPKAVTVLFPFGEQGVSSFAFEGAVSLTETTEGELVIEKSDGHFAVVKTGFLYYEIGDPEGE